MRGRIGHRVEVAAKGVGATHEIGAEVNEPMNKGEHRDRDGAAGNREHGYQPTAARSGGLEAIVPYLAMGSSRGGEGRREACEGSSYRH